MAPRRAEQSRAEQGHLSVLFQQWAAGSSSSYLVAAKAQLGGEVVPTS